MLNKTKTYLILNPCSSPVAISTRDDSFIVPGGTKDAPGSLPFSIDEIIQINAGSPVFKTGCLYFEEEYEADIYNELRIRNWKDILREEDVEDIILNPTIEKLQKVLDIESDFYFERLYGIYIGMKNANYAIPANVQTVFSMRHKEFKNGKRKSGIVLTKKESAESSEVAELKEKLKKMEQMMARLAAVKEAVAEPAQEQKPVEKKKPATRKRTTTKAAEKHEDESAPKKED